MKNSLGSYSLRSLTISSRLLFVALLAATGLLALPVGAGAVHTITVDIKAHPSVFKAGKQVNLPVYLVENRAPDSDPTSWFTQYPLGIRHIGFDIGSSQSKMVSFTPVARMDYRGKYFYNNTMEKDTWGQSRVWLSLYSTVGLTGTPDNSGITGRTEIKLGTLKVLVGPSIKKGSRKIVFDAEFLGDPSFGAGGGFDFWTKLGKANDITGGGTKSMNGMEKKGIRVFSDDSSSAGMAPGDGIKSAPKKIKAGKKAKLKLTCSTGCQLSPTLKIGKSKVRGLKDLKVKAGAKSASFGLPAKATAKVKKALSKGTKVTLTLTPKSREGSGRAAKIQIR